MNDPRNLIKYEKWLKWIDVIYDDIVTLLYNRRIHYDIEKIIKTNPAINKRNYFNTYFRDTFQAYILIGIRRQIKVKKDSISLMRCLHEIAEDPSFLRERGYDINSKAVRADIKRVSIASHKTVEFVDKYIAHRDQLLTKKSLLLRRSEWNRSVNTVAKMYLKYCKYFDGEKFGIWPPNGQTLNCDWDSLFSIPWIEK